MLVKRKRGRKPRRNLLPLLIKAAFYGSQFGDNIQLEASYKAFMDGTGKCGKGPSLLTKQDKATREQISRARQLEEDLIREDLCDQDQDHVSPNPYDRHMLLSVNRRSLPEHEEVVTRPNRSKTLVDRLQTAKREKEDLKIKSVDSSTAYNRTYIVVNIRKKSNHCVEIGKSPFCDCENFMKNSEKEFWKDIKWTLRYLIFVDCRKTVICCSSYASVNSSCQFHAVSSKILCVLIGNCVRVKSSGLANARSPGGARFANAPSPRLTRRAVTGGGGGGWAQLELTDALLCSNWWRSLDYCWKCILCYTGEPCI